MFAFCVRKIVVAADAAADDEVAVTLHVVREPAARGMLFLSSCGDLPKSSNPVQGQGSPVDVSTPRWRRGQILVDEVAGLVEREAAHVVVAHREIEGQLVRDAPAVLQIERILLVGILAMLPPPDRRWSVEADVRNRGGAAVREVHEERD